MIEYLTTNKCGSKKINYRLREWIFARQRYWGEPVPIIHLENGKNIALEDKDLPLILPVLKDYKGKMVKHHLITTLTGKMLLLMESKVKEKHRQCLARQVHHGTI